MDVNACLTSQKMEILLKALIILPALDQFAHFWIEGLDAHFELQRAGRERRNDFAQRLGQPVRHHLEMKEMALLISFEKEFQDRFTRRDIQIEGAIHEFELFDSALEQPPERFKQRRQRNLSHWHIQR